MKKAPNNRASRKTDMLPEYDFTKGVRGKYAQRFAQGANIVLLSPDVAEVFSDSESVNEALRALIRIAHRTPRKRPRSSTSKTPSR